MAVLGGDSTRIQTNNKIVLESGTYTAVNALLASIKALQHA